MSGVAGILNIADSDYVTVNSLGQQVVYDAVNEILRQWNEDVVAASSVFIERTTENFKFKHYLPGGGEMQVLGGQAPAAAVKRYGSYDVALQLRDYGDEIAGSRRDLAYMSITALDAQLKNIQMRALATLRRRIMTSIFEDTQYTFDDPVHGNLTIEHLANGDTVVYPPVWGATVEAIDDHYLEAGYVVAAIATGATNPVITLRDEIAEHYGGLGSFGRDFVFFHNTDATEYLAAITGYHATADPRIHLGDDTAYLASLPGNVPGRVHGYLDGCWLSEWPAGIPATYAVMVLLGIPAPLYMRIHPARVALGSGLQLVKRDDSNYPMERSSFEFRFGVGIVNRLAAAVMEITEDATYAPPTGYTE